MIIIPGPIPIVITPYFWLFAGLIGWLNSQSIIGSIIWVGIILLSVLFHEFGHALTAVFFHQKAQIQLVALGGVTSFHGPKLKFWQQFLIALNGPLAGILLFAIASLLLKLPLAFPILAIIASIRIVNLIWSIINLLPVAPLDGGQLLRIALEGFLGVKGFKASLLIGMLFAFFFSFYFFLAHAFLIGAFFFLFAFQNFEVWRKSRNANSSDREDQYKKMLGEAENLLNQGNKEQAQKLLEEIVSKTFGGLLCAVASQYLAFLYIDEGKKKEAYELLLKEAKLIEGPARCLLHRLAFEEGNYALVAELSAECYQMSPSQEMAIMNAKSFGHLQQPKPAGGWLQTAWQQGHFDLNQVLQDGAFTGVRHDEIFRQFVDLLYEKKDS